MSTFLPKDVLAGLDSARIAALKKTSRLRVMAGDEVFPVLSRWDTGFSVDAAEVPALRGLVDLYDGTRHLCQCLIVASEAGSGELRYEFKRATPVSDRPPLDFFREPDAPTALIPRDL